MLLSFSQFTSIVKRFSIKLSNNLFQLLFPIFPTFFNFVPFFQLFYDYKNKYPGLKSSSYSNLETGPYRSFFPRSRSILVGLTVTKAHFQLVISNKEDFLCTNAKKGKSWQTGTVECRKPNVQNLNRKVFHSQTFGFRTFGLVRTTLWFGFWHL